MLFWWICGGESVLPVLLLRHLGSSSELPIFIKYTNILEVYLVLLLRNSSSSLTYFMLYKISSPKCHICTIRNYILYSTGNNFIQVMSEMLNDFIHKNDKDYSSILLYINLLLSFKIDDFKLKVSVPLLNFRIK